jgi:hypothetical protein
MALLSTLTATAAGKAATAIAGLALTGGGIGVAVNVAADDADHGLQTALEAQDAEAEDAEAEDLDADLVLETVDTPEDGVDTPENGVETPEEGPERPDESRADDVHDALVDGADVRPGDEEFGSTVAENAREHGRDFGQSVADAARGDNGPSEGEEGDDTSGDVSNEGDERSAEGQSRAEDARGSGEQPEDARGSGGQPEDAGTAREDAPRGGDEAAGGNDTATDARAGSQGGPRG